MELYEELKQRIGEKRFQHTLRVVEVAKKLAEYWSVDIEKTETAALLHDCMKLHEKEELFQASSEFGLPLTEEMKESPQIIHGPLGAAFAKKQYGIKDEEVLHAIKVHTTGCKNMSSLDKIIFLADYIEPKRNFSGVELVRELAYQDLDFAVLTALEQTLKHLLETKQIIALTTVKARNYYRREYRE